MFKRLWLLVFYFVSAHSMALQNMKAYGEEVKVEDNDIFALLMTIAGLGVALFFGFLCVKALFQVLHTTWEKWQQWHDGKATANEIIMPLAAGALLVLLTVAISTYVYSVYRTFMVA